MYRFCHAVLLGSVLIASLTAQDRDHDRDRDRKEDSRRYHDKRHNDDHEWNNNEDRAYRMWATERHRKYGDFGRLSSRDQQNYWSWRHDHSNALLKIEIH